MGGKETMKVIDGKVGDERMMEFLGETGDEGDDLLTEIMIGVKI